MEDLIYSFLLQSGYPRASIILDVGVLGYSAGQASDVRTPTFVIVEPESADVLGVINVVDAVNAEELKQLAIETGSYAARLGGKSVQGFVVRLDPHGRSEAEKLQFYKVWPNSTLQRLTSKTFPDLQSLHVAKKLADARKAATTVVPEIVDVPVVEDEVDVTIARPGPGMYLPALLLVGLIALDSWATASRGMPIMSLSQSILAFGAALLFTIPAAIRFWRS